MAKRFLYLNSRDEFFRVDISKIVYFEADGNYTNIILSNKVRGTVSKEALKKLRDFFISGLTRNIPLNETPE